MQREFEGTTPSVAESAFVSEMAYLIGDVTLKADVSVWPFVCLRGDYGPITVGAETNVQDFTMLHEATIGSRVTIGHNVVVDRATIGDDALVGISSTILPGATIEDNSIVAAGSLIREDQEVPSGHMAYGAPAEIQPLSESHYDEIRWYCEEYLTLSERYRNNGSGHSDKYEDHQG